MMPTTVAGKIAGRDLPDKWRPEFDRRVAEAEREAVANLRERIEALPPLEFQNDQPVDAVLRDDVLALLR